MLLKKSSNNTKKKLILHIGMHKTGSTAIQASLHASRKHLLGHGINYLDKVRMNHSTTFVSLFGDDPHKYHINVQSGINTPERAEKHNRSLRKIVSGEFADNECEKFVVSGEGLSILSLEGVKKLKNYIGNYFSDVRVVFYARRPLEFYKSMCQQYIVGGRTLEQLKSNPPLPEYRFRLEKYLTTFGEDSVTVRLFDRDQLFNGDVVSDFLKILGLDSGSIEKIKKVQTNESVSDSAIRVINRINEKYPAFIDNSTNPERGAFIRKAFVLAAEKSLDSKFEIPCFYGDEYLSVVNEDIDWINQYMDHGQFVEKITKKELASSGGELPNDIVSLDFVAELVNELQNVSERRMAKIEGLERKLSRKGLI